MDEDRGFGFIASDQLRAHGVSPALAARGASAERLNEARKARFVFGGFWLEGWMFGVFSRWMMVVSDCIYDDVG